MKNKFSNFQWNKSTNFTNYKFLYSFFSSHLCVCISLCVHIWLSHEHRRKILLISWLQLREMSNEVGCYRIKWKWGSNLKKDSSMLFVFCFNCMFLVLVWIPPYNFICFVRLKIYRYFFYLKKCNYQEDIQFHATDKMLNSIIFQTWIASNEMLSIYSAEISATFSTISFCHQWMNNCIAINPLCSPFVKKICSFSLFIFLQVNIFRTNSILDFIIFAYLFVCWCLLFLFPFWLRLIKYKFQDVYYIQFK